MGLGTFVVAIAVALFSSSLLSRVGLVPAFLVLGAIIGIHILCDVVGTSAMAASEAPFHSMAANRIPEARVAIKLVRNADRVANIANDLVGDVAGTISGAVGAAIVFRVIRLGGLGSETWLSALMIGVISAVTVGGKAGSKTFALRHADEIIFALSKVLYRLETILGVDRRSGRNHGRR